MDCFVASLQTDHLMNVLIAVAVIVGLVFLSLSIMTFALYSRNPVTNAALINLSINLLLFHLLSLIKTFSLTHIQPLVSFPTSLWQRTLCFVTSWKHEKLYFFSYYLEERERCRLVREELT